jgi:hypothetical protein
MARVYEDANQTLKARALWHCIFATPTDGLGITDSDLDQIGADSYEEVDEILWKHIHRETGEYDGHPVVKRYLKSYYKRENPYNLSRAFLRGDSIV